MINFYELHNNFRTKNINVDKLFRCLMYGQKFTEDMDFLIKVLCLDIQFAIHYVIETEHNEVLPLIKHIFLVDVYCAYYYCYLTDSSFPEGEKLIATDPDYKRQYENAFGVVIL